MYAFTRSMLDVVDGLPRGLAFIVATEFVQQAKAAARVTDELREPLTRDQLVLDGEAMSASVEVLADRIPLAFAEHLATARPVGGWILRILDAWSTFLPARIASEDLGDYVEDINNRIARGQRPRPVSYTNAAVTRARLPSLFSVWRNSSNSWSFTRLSRI